MRMVIGLPESTGGPRAAIGSISYIGVLGAGAPQPIFSTAKGGLCCCCGPLLRTTKGEPRDREEPPKKIPYHSHMRAEIYLIYHSPTYQRWSHHTEDGTAVGAAGEEETNVLRSLLAPEEEGRFHFLLGKTYEQAENWLGAFFEYRMAVPFFQTDGEMLDAIERHGRRVASEIKDTHKIISVLLQDLEVVRERGAGTFHKAPDGSQPAVDVN